MTASSSRPPRPTLLTAGRWGSGPDASGSLRVRRQLGDTISLAHDEVHVTGLLTDTALLLDAAMTVLPSRRQKRIFGAESLTSTVRMVRPIGLAPGLWRAPAMVTIAGLTELVKVDITVTMMCTTALRPALDVTMTMLNDARIFGLRRSRGLAGPLTMSLRATLTEPTSASSQDSEPWAYAA